MCSRTYITIIVFIICEFVFSEKAFFGLGTGIRKKWLNSIFQQPMGDCRSLYPASATTICGFSLDILSYNALKVRLSCYYQDVLYIQDQPCLSQAVFTAYAKTCLCSPFRKPSTFRIFDLCIFVFSHLQEVLQI